MYLIGSICLSLGMVWDFSFPINKHIWTSSYVLFSSGLAMLFLASCMWIIDHKKIIPTPNLELSLAPMLFLHTYYTPCLEDYLEFQL